MALKFTPTKFLQSTNEKLENELKPKESLSIEIDTTTTPKEGIDILWYHFPYEIHTFQYIKTDIKSGRTHSPVKLYRDKETALKEAIEYNSEGYDVFFMVNEGDGIIHPGKKVPRCQEAVKNLSCCFIDTDDCPIEKVDKYLESIYLLPDLRIESSPGRYHLYFFITPSVVKNEENILKWKAIQNMLHRLGDETIKNPSKTLGMDSTMHDYSKVLRVPGFMHVSKLTTVKVIEVPWHDL